MVSNESFDIDEMATFIPFLQKRANFFFVNTCIINFFLNSKCAAHSFSLIGFAASNNFPENKRYLLAFKGKR